MNAGTPSSSSFDAGSGSRAERLLFGHRGWIVAICAVVTVLLAWSCSRLELRASYERVMPSAHPYVKNFIANRAQLPGLGNTVRMAAAAREGATILDASYLEALRSLSDEVYLLPGVDRPYMRSLWTPNTRWTGVTEDGFDGGPVMPDRFDGSRAAQAALRLNIERSGEIGQLVAPDFRSSVLLVPLLAVDPATGRALDYAAFSQRLEALRSQYAARGLDLHITGFAKVVGDLIEGLRAVLLFFAGAVALTALVLYAYTRCLRSTALVVLCSLTAVLWQLGLLPLMGYALDPYSILVPFLVFAIGMSHGAQKMNGIMQDIGRGAHRLVAARLTFRRLFMAGLTALLCDVVGFAVLAAIDIPVIRDVALIASIGVAVLIFTNLVLLPVLLSYVGVDAGAAARSLRIERTSAAESRLIRWLAPFATRRAAPWVIGVSAMVATGGYAVSRQLQIGDLDAGAPELRTDSRYNRDAAFMMRGYGASSDVFVVIVRTPDGACAAVATQTLMDELEWRLQQVPGVAATQSLASMSRLGFVGMNEGQLKWLELVPNQGMLNAMIARAPRELVNADCNTLPLSAYLHDHKAATLSAVSREVEAFAAAHDTAQVRFLPAAGNAGIEAATNEVVGSAMHTTLAWVYAAVSALCLIAFRSWRATLVAVVPLLITSVLCEALMVALGIGVKVATLPVIALGVGIGVDYALYVLSIMLARLRAGDSVEQAYVESLRFTGRVVLLTGITLALAVGSWAFSPIKFQADMGILLAFMFVWNLIGALVLLPALAHYLLRPATASPAAAPERRPLNSVEVRET